MSNLFNQVKSKVDNSPWVIVFFFLFIYGTYLGWMMFLEDYAANVETFSSFPTVKSNADMAGIMARFVQLAPLLFGFGWMRNTANTRQGALAMGFLLFDWCIGTYYRTNALSLSMGWIIWAAAEDLVYFTAGSELLLTLCAGTALSLLIPAVEQTIELVESLFAKVVGSPKKTQKTSARRSHQPTQTTYFGRKP